MSKLSTLYSEGKVVEFFGVGTAAIIAPVNKIGWNGQDLLVKQESPDGLGVIGHGILEMITGIQTGKTKFEDWSVPCE